MTINKFGSHLLQKKFKSICVFTIFLQESKESKLLDSGNKLNLYEVNGTGKTYWRFPLSSGFVVSCRKTDNELIVLYNDMLTPFKIKNNILQEGDTISFGRSEHSRKKNICVVELIIELK